MAYRLGDIVVDYIPTEAVLRGRRRRSEKILGVMLAKGRPPR